MKIIIDAYQYSPSITGTDRMAFNFLTELQRLDKKNTYIILCSREKYTRSSLMSNNFKTVVPPFICSFPYIGRYFSYFWRKYVKYRLPRLAADVYFSFHNMTLPEKRVAKQMIASNLDLIPVVLDEYKGLGRLSAVEQLKEYERVASLADRFVSISEYSKNELNEVLGAPTSKIEVIYLAAAPDFKLNHNVQNIVEGKYIFTVGGSEPRKNVKTVIEAYLRLPDTIKSEYSLAVAGGKWHGNSLEYKKDDHIIELGYVPDDLLPGLYANSSVFVFASIYEGFGFTILEAMAAGSPVINARGSSLDEVAGNATLSFNPNSPQELTEQLVKVLGDPILRKDLIKKGYVQNANFSWQKSAEQLHKLLVEN
jgi:glycosyltransferase involved in cell wall biosynthesis